jgi:hypothetical protein
MTKHLLPNKLESLLHLLSEYYGKRGKGLLQKLVVNSAYTVEEGADYDNYDDGAYGHAIHFSVPTPIYHEVIDSLDQVKDDLKSDLNRIKETPGEWICDVFVEVETTQTPKDWRRRSGAYISDALVASEPEANRLWPSGSLRLFISHKSDAKKLANEIKAALEMFGVSSFVAHEDIEPTREWQDEIENALASMNVLVALLTPDFHQSNWTDQEIGVAIGRKVPVLSVGLGSAPYGFIGKYQALAGMNKTGSDIAKELIELLLGAPALKDIMLESLVTAFEHSASFRQSNLLIELLPRLGKPSPALIRRIENAATNNSQVKDCWKVGQLNKLVASWQK